MSYYKIWFLFFSVIHFMSCPQKPCPLENSMFPNPGFEDIVSTPYEQNQLFLAKGWKLPTLEGTTDLIYFDHKLTRPGVGDISIPPNKTKLFAGIQIYKNIARGSHHEYLGANIVIEKETEYFFAAYVGAGKGSNEISPDENDNFARGFEGELVLLGLKNDTLPLPGRDCKSIEKNIYTLASIPLKIKGGEWLKDRIQTIFIAPEKFSAILVGLNCEIEKRSYLLIDDLFLVESDLCLSKTIK